MIFDKAKAKEDLEGAISENSEHSLLAVLKKNTFLFADIYYRQWGIQPVFSEVPFGSDYRCDFCWLNDNSDGPEWTLVEIEKPVVRLFNQNGDPSSKLNHAIEQIRSWDRYFQLNNAEKARIFGAVSKFRFVLVVGTQNEWSTKEASLWKSHFNANNNIEIRSMETFNKALRSYNEDPNNLSFEQYPKAKKSSELSAYISSNTYLDHWKVQYA